MSPTAQALKHNADFLLRRKMPAGRAANVLKHFFSRRLGVDAIFAGLDFCLIFAPCQLRRVKNPPLKQRQKAFSNTYSYLDIAPDPRSRNQFCSLIRRRDWLVSIMADMKLLLMAE